MVVKTYWSIADFCSKNLVISKKEAIFAPEMKTEVTHTGCLRWRRFSRKSYAVFCSLRREVSIGVLGVSMLASCAFVGQDNKDNNLQQGDLLFCIEQADGGGLGEAITSVTQGAQSLSISHVAIYVGTRTDEGAASASPCVIEAVPGQGVRLIAFQDFIENAGHDSTMSPLVIAGRLRDTAGVAMSIQRSFRYLGRPYDYLYEPTDSAIYCSELVQLSYLRSDGRAVFPTIGMTFRDASGEIAPYWQQLYAEHGRPVPEGEPGTNPGTMSRDTSLYLFDLSSRKQ